MGASERDQQGEGSLAAEQNVSHAVCEMTESSGLG